MSGPLEEITAQLQSNDQVERGPATRKAGAFLRWAFLRDARPDITEGNEGSIGDDLRGRPVTEEDEERLVGHLHELFVGSIDRPDVDGLALLQAIGKAKPWLSARPFIDLLVEHREGLTEGEVHEIVHSLDTSLHLIRRDPRLARVAGAFKRQRARIVFADIAAGTRSDAYRCMPDDGRRILDAIANRVSDQIDEAREYTAQLRGTDEYHWATTRTILRERGIDPAATAVGGWIPEQSGPFLIMVQRGAPTFILELGYRGDEEVEVLAWRDLDPLRSYPYSLDVYAALVVLSDESPVTPDPIDVLVEDVTRSTNNLLRDEIFAWRGLRRFLVEHGLDPHRAILIDPVERWVRERAPVREGTLLCDGRLLEFIADVEHPSGVGVTQGEITRVRMWQVDGIQARLRHGVLIDAAFRLEANERRAQLGSE